MKNINGQTLKQLFLSGANNLYNHYPQIDQLNVFPVPDGDTGMNMNLTLTSGAKEIQNKNDENIYEIARSFSKGLLMGARGNSGVITSQIFRGFSQALEGKSSVNAKELAEAFVVGKEVAYKAVMRPVEGTILTVIRESSAALKEEVAKKKDMSIENALDYLLVEAKKSLEHTPDLLPILKEVGVVDSGGAGLCVVLEGMALAAHNKFVERSDVGDASEGVNASSLFPQSAYAGAKISEDEEGYGYCTQFILRLGKPEQGKKPFIEKRFQNFLASHGKSLVLVRDEDIVKVHVHTLNPGIMLNYAQNYGEFVTITIENMSEEHDNISHGDKATDMDSNLERKSVTKEEEPQELKDYALIAVSSGSGLDEMFKELGVQEIVSGGQTMNPSTSDFVDAIKKAHAKNVFILPNNSNIVMAASQACDVQEGDDVKARVVPSKTIPQGMVSLMQFNGEQSPDDNFNSMKGALKSVVSGSVTYAIKDTDMEGFHITKGYYMAMKEGKDIVACVKDKMEALLSLSKEIVNEDTSILTVFYGSDVSEEEGKQVGEALAKAYPEIDLDVRSGGQPVYSFLVGAE